MFTGIIHGIGHIINIRILGELPEHGKCLTIQAPTGFLEGVQLGDSIALNGACMTVIRFDTKRDQFSLDISRESLNHTTGLDTRGRINLEKALQAGDRLGGHLVSGHVDGLGQVASFTQIGESWELQIKAPLNLAKYLAHKGSVTINGVSLTINQVTDLKDACQISINLIPHTVQHTTLGELTQNQAVNLEIDQIARYCERMLSYQNTV
jgi:riboflavin synthase